MALPHNTPVSAAKAIRTATAADLDSVVEVVRSAMPLDPQWNFRFQYGDQFPEDNIKYTKLLFQHFIDPAYDDWHVIVAEAPSLEDPEVTKIVGFAVWDVTYRNKRKLSSDYKPQNPMLDVAKAGGSTRRDVNPKRQAAFREAASEGKKRIFDAVYGDDQIHLQILGTHPEYMRRSFGSLLVSWGVSVAREDDLVVTVMASPMGILLYSHLKFQRLGEIKIQAPEETEKTYLEAMVLNLQEQSPVKHEL